MSEIILINSFVPQPGKLDALQEMQLAESQRLGAESAEYGWLGNTIYRNEDAGRLVIVTRFRNEAGKAAWQQSAAFADHLRRLEPLLERVDSAPVALVATNSPPQSPLRLAIITGSTREGRFGERPAQWIADVAAAHGGFSVTPFDLRDYPMPFLGDPAASAAQTAAAGRFALDTSGYDAYLLVAAEYNHAPTAVLKNALDHADWQRRPVAFVGYGGVGGARAVEHLRMITAEMRMVAVRDAVHILYPEYKAVADGAHLQGIPRLQTAAAAMLGELAWWAAALRDA